MICSCLKTVHLQQLKGMQGSNYVFETSTTCKWKVYQRGTFSGGALAREAHLRAPWVPWLSKFTHPRKFGNHVTVQRPPRPSAPEGHQCSISHFLASWEHRETDIAHILYINVVINWQLSKQGIRWPVSPDRIAGSGVDPSRSSIFLKLSADKLLVFKWSQAQV